ncbi:hypothetical protein DFS34DRAFT_683407 [Phlyctochytrium arcticum]|nr:hypothetical protein DFS34DRAFT_683407 [Phlyctochytrium arcticum]
MSSRENRALARNAKYHAEDRIFLLEAEKKSLDVEVEGTEIVDAVTNKFEKEITHLRSENHKLASEVMDLESIELDLNLQVKTLQNELELLRENKSGEQDVEDHDVENQTGIRNRDGMEEDHEKEIEDEQNKEDMQHGEESEEDLDNMRIDSDCQKANSNARGGRRGKVTKFRAQGGPRNIARLQEIEEVDIDKFTAILTKCLTHRPNRANPRCGPNNRAIVNAIKRAMPDVEEQLLAPLAQGVGPSFMAEDAANAAFLTLLQQVFAAASTAISFRQLAIECRDQYLANR